MHLWPDNWKTQNPSFISKWMDSHAQAAEKLGKPLVMEEFGKNSTNPFDFSAPDEAKRTETFRTVFDTLQKSLDSAGVLRAASYWMFDPSIQNAQALGFEDFGQDQVPVDSPTFKDIIVPAARAAAAVKGQVEGCVSGTVSASGRKMLRA